MTEGSKPRRTPRKPRGKVVAITEALAEANAAIEEAFPANQDVELPGMPEVEYRFAAIDGVRPVRWGVALGGKIDYPQHDAPESAELLLNGARALVSIQVLDEAGLPAECEPIVVLSEVGEIGHPTKKGRHGRMEVTRLVKLKVQGA